MSKKRIETAIASLLIVIAVAFAATGCFGTARVGDLQTKSQTVGRDGTDPVNVEIQMGAGKLDVSGGASELLEASFTYNVEELNPQATFADGRLEVKDSGVKLHIASLAELVEFRNEWDLKLNEAAPMEMKIELGAGSSKLALGPLALTSLNIKGGAGDVELDLNGSRSLRRFDFDLGAGDVTIDLAGEWQNDLDARIRGGLGDLNLRLPSDVGVRIDVETGIGGVDTRGLTREGDTYTNNAYGVSDVTLRIDIDSGVGQTDLEVVETGAQGDPQTAMISGWVWHDLCESGKDGEPAPATTPEGCVQEDSPIGNYHAEGAFSNTEPLIESVVVSLGEGACPSTGLAEMPTITTDLSYSFSGLKAGTYCVSIDPQREPNFSILRPGEWTYPAIEQGVINTTVTLYSGEYRGMVNFGWDYQFQP